MSLSCYHGEEGSTPEGRDAQFKTEEQEQYKIFVLFFCYAQINPPSEKESLSSWMIYKVSAVHTMTTFK